MNNPYLNPCGYTNPYMMNVAPQRSAIRWVSGPEEANNEPVAPGDSKLMMDANESVFYIKTVEINGRPRPLQTFDFKERLPEQPVVAQPTYMTREDVEKMIAESKSDTHDYLTKAEFKKQMAGYLAAMNGGDSNE